MTLDAFGGYPPLDPFVQSVPMMVAVVNTFCNRLHSWVFELPNQARMKPVNMLSTVHLKKFKRVFLDILYLLVPNRDIDRLPFNVLDPRQIFRDLHVQELKLSALATTNLVIKTGLWILCCFLPNSETKNTDVP